MQWSFLCLCPQHLCLSASQKGGCCCLFPDRYYLWDFKACGFEHLLSSPHDDECTNALIVAYMCLWWWAYQCPHSSIHVFHPSEPGIRRGNEDSHGNENRKSQKKYFLLTKKAYFCTMKIQGTKPIIIVNFSVLDFFKFAPECLKLYMF